MNRPGRLFWCTLALQVLVFLLLVQMGDRWLEDNLLDRHPYRVPNLREQQPDRAIPASAYYLDRHCQAHGPERMVAFVGDSIVYGHGTSPRATFTGVCQQLAWLGPDPEVHFLNLGCDGTNEAYSWQIVDMLADRGVDRVYCFINIRD